MSPRPAILFSVLFAILLPFYLAVDRHNAFDVKVEEHQHANLLDLSAIDAVTVKRGNESLRFEKTSDGKLFKVVSPAGGFIPQDLMNAMTSLFLKSSEVEVIAEKSENLSQFGLDHPSSQIEIAAPGKAAPLKLVFGSENPTHTAFYAKLEDSPKVFLLGLDLKYYQDLMFEWIEGKHGKKA